MNYVLLHHKGCSTSRNGLALLESNNVTPKLRLYMNAGEALTIEDLKDLTSKLGAGSPRNFLREKNASEVGITDASTDDEIYKAMILHPKIIQRPIGIRGDQAVVGRPIERLLEIL